MKKCRTCGEDKPLSEYHRQQGTRDGLRRSCKPCRSAALNKWRKASPAHREYVERNRESERERQRRYYEKHRERLKAAARKWYEENQTRASEAAQRYYAEHREKATATMRRNYASNREAYVDRAAKRRALLRGVQAEVVDRQLVFERDGGLCALCGQPVDPVKWDMDHIIPLAMGGVHSYENVQVTHPSCNRRKGVRILER